MNRWWARSWRRPGQTGRAAFVVVLAATHCVPGLADEPSAGGECVNVSDDGCPPGYRLHYQGLCINIEDEMADDGAGPIRTVQPCDDPNNDVRRP